MPDPDAYLRRLFRLARRRSRSLAPEETASVQPGEFAASSAQISRAIAPYRQWIESRLGIPLEEAMILRTPLQVSQLALLNFDTDLRLSKQWPDELQRFAEAAEQVVHAPQANQVLKLLERSSTASLEDRQAQYDMHQVYELVWIDGPVALRLRGLACEVVAAGCTYRDALGWDELTQNVLILRRAEIGLLTRC